MELANADLAIETWSSDGRRSAPIGVERDGSGVAEGGARAGSVLAGSLASRTRSRVSASRVRSVLRKQRVWVQRGGEGGVQKFGLTINATLCVSPGLCEGARLAPALCSGRLAARNSALSSASSHPISAACELLKPSVFSSLIPSRPTWAVQFGEVVELVHNRSHGSNTAHAGIDEARRLSLTTTLEEPAPMMLQVHAVAYTASCPTRSTRCRASMR